MACEYKFKGLILNEEQFHSLLTQATETLQQMSKSAPDHINEEHIKAMFEKLQISDVNHESLSQINDLNQSLGDQYNTDEEFITINEDGNFEINNELMNRISDNMDRVAEMTPNMVEAMLDEILFNTPNANTGFSNDPAKQSRFVKMINYKKSLISRLESQYNKLEAYKSQLDSKSKEYDEILDTQKEITTRLNGRGYEKDHNYVPGLKREIKTLMDEKEISALDNYLFSDLQRLITLSTRDDIDSINESKKILNFFKSLTLINPDSTLDNQIFSNVELTDPALKPAITRIKGIADSIINEYEEKISALEISHIEKILNNDTYIQKIIAPLKAEVAAKKAASGDLSPVSDYEVFFKQSMKDINKWDKYMSDGVVGTFSDFGQVTQLASEIFAKHLQEFEGRDASFNQRMKELVPKVNAKLNSLGYGIKLMGTFGIGTTYKLFKQVYRDGKQTGHLINRRSAEYMEKWNDITDEFTSVFNKVETETAGGVAFQLINSAYKKRADSLRKIAMQIDPRKIQAVKDLIATEFKEFAGYMIDDGGVHEKALMDNIKSQKGLEHEIAQQVEKVRRYQVEYKRELADILNDEGVLTYGELSDDGKNKMKKFMNENNPFIAAEYFESGIAKKIDGVVYHSNITRYNSYIPLRNVNGSESGFYDKNFDTIEADEDLLGFWKLAGEIQDLRKYLPLQQQRELAGNMIPSKKKSFQDILMDKDTLAADKLSQAFHRIGDNFKSAFLVHKSSIKSRDEITDSVTGVEENSVSLGLVTTNGQEIRDTFRRSYVGFIQTLKTGYSDLFKNETGADYIMTKHSTIPFSGLSKASKIMLADVMGVSHDDSTLMSELGITKDTDNINIGRILYKDAVSSVVENETFNLPQTLKLYSAAVALYAGRNAAMPIIDVIRRRFKEIKNPNLNNTGDMKNTVKEGGRDNANQVFDKWFQKIVLGQIHPDVAGVASKKIYPLLKDRNAKKGQWKADITLSSLTHDEKIIVAELDKLIDAERAKPQDQWNTELIEKLELSKQNIGRYFAVSAFHDRFMDVARIVGMGVNAVAGFSNFIQGKTSNFINGASGLYMKHESMLRGEHIVIGSHIKLTGIGKVTKWAKLTEHEAPSGAKKLAIMIQRFKVFQDSSNEVYKSTIDTAVVDPSIFNIYIIQQRTEYVNQAPILAGLLVDREITGTNGETSTVWDALNTDGTLKDNFRTPENIATWEMAESSEASTFINKVADTIADFQGDYKRLGGSVYSNDMAYKTTMMFKRWMPRYVHVRFAKEYESRGLDRKTKGRYRALSAASGTVMFGLTALAVAGTNPVLLGLGIVGGGLFGHKYGSKNSTFSGDGFLIDYFKELTVNLVQVAARSALVVPQIAATPFTSKSVTKGLGKTVSNFVDNGHRDNDLDNGLMRANMAEMSLIVMTIMARLIMKAMTKDDDKDEDKELLNLALNLCGRTVNDLTLFLNPKGVYESITNIAVIRMAEGAIKLGDVLSEALEGNSLVVVGPDAGENKAFGVFRKTFMPGLLRDDFGFGSNMKKVNDTFGSDKFDFAVSEKQRMENLITQTRTEYRTKLAEQLKAGISDEKVSKVADALMKHDPTLERSVAERKARRLLEAKMTNAAKNTTLKLIPSLSKRRKDITKKELEANIDSVMKKHPLK